MADGKVIVETDLDSSGIEAGISRMGSAVKAGIAAMGIGKAVQEIAQIGTAAIQAGSDFEAQMSRVQAVSGATGEEFTALRDQALQLGADTSFSAQEAAQGMESLAAAGFTTSEIMDAMPGLLDLAAASGEDLATSSDIAASTLRGFGLAASEAGHVADVLATNANRTNSSVAQTGEAMKYVAPLARAAGISMEETAAAIGIMANAGIQGSQAGTTLRGAISRLSKPTSQMQEAMDELGISFYDSEGKMKSLADQTAMLNDAMAGMTEEQRNNYLVTLYGQEALSGMLALMNEGDGALRELTTAYQECDGAAEETARTMQDNFAGAVEELTGSLETLGITFFDSIEEPLRGAAEAATDSVNRITDAFESGGMKGAVQEVGDIFLEFLDDVGGTSDAAKAVTDSIKKMITVFSTTGKTAVPVAADALELLADNLDIIIPLAEAGVAVFAGYKILSSVAKWYTAVSAASKAYAAAMTVELTATSAASVAQTLLASTMSATELVVGVLTGRVTLATAAQVAMTSATSALNTALSFMAANPIAVLAVGIGTLIGVTTLINNHFKQYEDVTVSLTEKQQELISTTDELTSAYNESMDARDEAIQGVMTEYGYYESLAGELQRITDENGRVKEGYEGRAAVITGELSEALGMEISMTDGVIDKYGEVVTAIDQVIEKKKAEAILASMQEDIAEAYTNSADALANYSQLQSEAAAQAEVVAEAQERYNTAMSNYENAAGAAEPVQAAMREELAAAGQELEKATAKQDELNGKTRDAKTVLEGYQNQISQYNTLAEALATGDAAAIEAALQQITSGYKSYTEETLKESADARQAMMDQARTAVDSLRTIQTEELNVGEELKQSTAETAAQAVADFAKLPGGIADAVSEIGPEASASMVATLAQANLKGLLNDEAVGNVLSFVNGLEGLDDGTKEQFVQACAGALEGLEGFEEIIPLAEEDADAFLEALAVALEVHSPSAAVARIFEQVWPGAAQGLESGQESLLSKGTEVITNFLSTLGSGIGEAAQNIGSSIMSFFGIGVSSQTGNSYAAGKANADSANYGAGSVNMTTTGALGSMQLNTGILSNTQTLYNSGVSVMTNAKTGAGTVNSTPEGMAFGTMMSRGIYSTSGALSASGLSIANSARSAAGSVRPTAEGTSFGTSYGTAISGRSSYASSSARNMANSAKNAAGSVSASSAGYNFGAGFGGGIRSAIGSAVSAAASLASRALSAIKSTLGIHSPARATIEAGEDTGEGFGIGLENMEPYVEKTSDQIGRAALKGMDISSQISRMRSVMNSEKNAIGNSMVLKVIHEVALGAQEDIRALAEKMEELKEHMDGIEIRMTMEGNAYIDGRYAGTVLSPTVNRRLGEFAELKGRGNNSR